MTARIAWQVHGYLSAICFALLLPLSIVLARGFKEYNPAWFHVHRVLGTIAWIGGASRLLLKPSA